MKKYQVVLIKSYIITIKSENKKNAMDLAEFYTSNISDISKKEDRKNLIFK